MDTLLLPILMLIVGVFVGVLVKSLSRFIKLPYTVVLFAIGLLVGALYKLDEFAPLSFMGSGVDMLSNMDPDFVLYVFLPILVFDAAYEMDLHVFRKTLVNASILAGPGLVICALLTAAMMMLLSHVCGGDGLWTWTYALMFGGLISATDPVAVVALLQELGTSKKFSTLVDGESLLNDGTGIVCFMLFYGAFAGETTNMGPVMFFCWVCMASIVIGLVVARLTLWFVTKVNVGEFVQNSVIIIASYATFILAQKVLGVSGVIALVVFGHVFAQSGKPRLKPAVNEFMSKFWGLLAFLANTLIFIMVGVIIAVKIDVTWMNILEIVIVYIGLNIIRYIMIWLLFPVLRKIGYGLSFRESVMLGWAGLRGALGMSLALMVSYTDSIPENIRSMILLFTAGVVTLTLCVNATLSKWLIGKLKLVRTEPAAVRNILSGIFNHLRASDRRLVEKMKAQEFMKDADWNVVSGYVHDGSDAAPITSADSESLLPLVRMHLLEKQRADVGRLFEEGVINVNSYNILTEKISEMADFNGQKPLSDITTSDILKIRSVDNRYDLCRGYMLVLELSAAILEKFATTDCMSLPAECSEKLRKEIEEAEKRITDCQTYISKENRDKFRDAVTQRAVRVLLAGERAEVEALHSDGIITDENADFLINDIEERAKGIGS